MTDRAPAPAACPTPGCDGDARYAAPGRRHREGCTHPQHAPAPAENDAAALHLRDHLTDGAWHDRCQFCLNRRVHGGTGVDVTNGGHK